MGYWFLLCLFEISVLGFIIIWGMEKLNKSAFWGIDLALICLIYILLRIFHVGAISISFLSLGYVVNAFMPFFVGVLLKKYRNLFKICIEESWFYTMLLLVFVMLFVSRYFMHFECFFMLFKISYHVLPLIGSLLVFHAFANGIFMNEYIRRVLCYIGVKSFPIYILHILFVIQIPQIGDFILEQNIITSIVFQLLYSLFLSVIAIILSLVSYKILAFSPLCRRSLFGE